MNALIKTLVLVLIVLAGSFFYYLKMPELKFGQVSLKSVFQNKPKNGRCSTPCASKLEFSDINKQYAPTSPGIFFLETSERMVLPSLVACSIESAARMYPTRPVYFLMKGLSDDTSIQLNSDYRVIFLLSSMKNVHILPLRFEALFKDTPLQSWYLKVDSTKQRYWIHHVSDACRQALLWKYGGIYMDTDVISIKPIPVEDFLAAESHDLCSSAVLGFQLHHPFIWACMEDYVKNYNGEIWAQQGPLLYTRMAEKFCKRPNSELVGDAMCSNFSYLQPRRFFPIPYKKWLQFYEIWDTNDTTFNISYALHFWNYMNKEHKEVTAGSNTVAEHLFKQYCPLTYDIFVKN
ncbi:alpha-1,4-N-acetylglucosaminyltransferase-like [Lissotriton helveticus]